MRKSEIEISRDGYGTYLKARNDDTYIEIPVNDSTKDTTINTQISTNDLNKAYLKASQAQEDEFLFVVKNAALREQGIYHMISSKGWNIVKLRKADLSGAHLLKKFIYRQLEIDYKDNQDKFHVSIRKKNSVVRTIQAFDRIPDEVRRFNLNEDVTECLLNSELSNCEFGFYRKLGKIHAVIRVFTPYPFELVTRINELEWPSPPIKVENFGSHTFAASDLVALAKRFWPWDELRLKGSIAFTFKDGFARIQNEKGDMDRIPCMNEVENELSIILPSHEVISFCRCTTGFVTLTGYGPVKLTASGSESTIKHLILDV